jgi:type I restriction enzyme S subunit
MTGGTPRTSVSEYYENGTVPWIVSGDIHKGEIFDCEKKITEFAVENSNARFLPKDSVLIALNGQGKTRGTVALLRIAKATCNQSIVSINPNDKEELFSDYLFYFLKSSYQQIRNITGDKDRAGLNMPLIREIKIPLPPLAEQKRIAAILDKADSLRRKRQQAIQLADEFLRAVFLELFGDPVTNPKGWDVAPMQEVSPSQPNRNVEVSDDEKIWLLNLDKVESNTGRLLDKEMCNYSEVGNSTSWFDGSHVLYSKLRPYLNKVVLPTAKGLATTELVPLKPNSELLTREYLTCLLRSDCFVNWANGKVAGAKMPRLSMAELRAFELPLPPLELQSNFSKIYKATMANLEKYRESDSSQVSLFNSLSQKAFKGELGQKNAA